MSLQREILEIRQEINQLKADNESNKEKVDTLNKRVDKLSQTVAENSLEIEKLKISKTTTVSSPPPPPPPPPQQLPREGKNRYLFLQMKKVYTSMHLTPTTKETMKNQGSIL